MQQYIVLFVLLVCYFNLGDARKYTRPCVWVYDLVDKSEVFDFSMILHSSGEKKN